MTDKASVRTFEDLVEEGASVPTEGWDFSWFEGRASEARPSWGYATAVAARLGAAEAVLDIQTGGGEVLDFALAHAPRGPGLAVATEGWPPNVAKATAVLRPRGVPVVASPEDAPLPFADGAFDLVLCVSTLEHVGADNTGYGLDAEDDGASRLTALRELRRVLAADGRLLITLPCGEPGEYGWFHQDDVSGWTRLLIRAGFFVEEQETYELTVDGWRAAPELDPTGLRYGERGPAASAVLCAELSPRRLRRLLSPDGIERTARRRAPGSLRRIRRIPRTG